MPKKNDMETLATCKKYQKKTNKDQKKDSGNKPAKKRVLY
jgi:hypothetical protein